MNAFQHLLVHDPLIASIFLLSAMLGIALPFYRMMRASTDFRSRVEGAIETTSGAKTTFSVNRSKRESFVIRLDTNAVGKARDLIRAGANIASVCRELEPEYASWRTIQQQAFQRAIQMMLKEAPIAQDSPKITSTKLK